MLSLFVGVTDTREAKDLKTLTLEDIKDKRSRGLLTQQEADVLVVELLEDYYQWCQEQNN
jgi:hypothetical protein